MDGAVTAGVVQGLALGGVLAVGAAWSRTARGGPLPHLGLGALAGVAVALGARLAAAPAPLGLLLVIVAGGFLGRLALALDQRVAGGPHESVGLADVAVLGAAVVIVGVLVPLGAAPLGVPPFGAGALATGAAPLGATAGPAGAVAALLLGGGAAIVLCSSRVDRRVPGGFPPARRWSLAGAGLAGSAVLGGGVLATTEPAVNAAVLGVADPVGLALRVAAAALAGRGNATEAAGAGLGLGLTEALVRVADPTGATVLLPTIGLALLSVLFGWRPDTEMPAGAQGRE